ncbi:MAG: class I SAM-dependent methyltransferase [Planctomycetes bacterium]|nr:class I SAM-dependent methyltransferase [Planctomycetota bacterium]
MACPVMKDPDRYLATRERSFVVGLVKRWVEERAVRRCLRDLPDLRTVCDAPSGPGRLFHLWKKLGFAVTGVDLSAPMLGEAERRLTRLGHPGEVRLGDAFSLRQSLPEGADLVSCVRFAYYFDEGDRVRLLASLAAASHRFVLVQYKTIETPRGLRNRRRAAAREGADLFSNKRFCTIEGIAAEFRRAGLVLRRHGFIGRSSDRVFALAEKTSRPAPLVPSADRLWSPVAH